MKFQILKFCYGVEIGAYLAYRGHYKVTGDKEIRRISKEELKHMVLIKRVLKEHNKTPNMLFNLMFLMIGYSVLACCFLTPHKALDIVASFLEKLNVFSYSYMAEQFPKYAAVFNEMQENENEHDVYFKKRFLQKKLA